MGQSSPQDQIKSNGPATAVSSPTPIAAPYSPAQWQRIYDLGKQVDRQLESDAVGLWIGGEPTFVSTTDFESWQWRTEALGEDKRNKAEALLQKLSDRLAPPGYLLHYGLGKTYGGEPGPRWALGCLWRTLPGPRGDQRLWTDPRWMAREGENHGTTTPDALRFLTDLADRLGIDPVQVMTAYEVDPEADARAEDKAERPPAGYVLPLLLVWDEEILRWASCPWQMIGRTKPQTHLDLLEGTVAIGLRLPSGLLVDTEDWCAEALAGLEQQAEIGPQPFTQAINSIRVALSAEVRNGTLRLFVPPLATPANFMLLVAAIEATAAALKIPVLLEGYPPPRGKGMEVFQVTPDPGVIEVNIHPASNWDELLVISKTLFEAAKQANLGTEKYSYNGQIQCSGGGAHITLGGATTEASPFVRRPDLLRSFLTYWNNHPSLSYLFCGPFVGPTSQAPRVDEARHESLYELEIAFQALKPFVEQPPEIVDRLLRNLLIDVTGNTHRSAFCIDKLYPLETPKLRLGLLEFRFFAMPPHEQMQMLEMLLVRAFTAWFWREPCTDPLIRWGTALHDRFLLPHYIRQDLRQVFADLRNAGFDFDPDWFEPFFAFRFPEYGAAQFTTLEGGKADLTLHHAIEPWHVLGEASFGGSTARAVDASMERIQVTLSLPDAAVMADSSYAVLCNGTPVPLQSTGEPNTWIAGVRFRAWELLQVLNPFVDPHVPLRFEVVDRATGQSIGACQYHTQNPNGELYDGLPKSTAEATERRTERFAIVPASAEPLPIKDLPLSEEYPSLLDLRRAV